MAAKNKAKKSSTLLNKEKPKSHLLFGKKNFIPMLIGAGLILLGFILMSGGGMDDPTEWDEDKIYSFRRITLAPALVLIGLGLQAYGIFKK